MQSAKPKFSLLGITKEYSASASVHGVGYVFSAATAVERFIWLQEDKYNSKNYFFFLGLC